MLTNRLAVSTTGTPLMPRSERSCATACTDMFGSTVITSVVMTSIARIGTTYMRVVREARATTGDAALTWINQQADIRA
jgi:hypothetical protein